MYESVTVDGGFTFYDDLYEFMHRGMNNTKTGSSRRFESLDWSGTKTYDEAVALYHSGWSYANEKLDKFKQANYTKLVDRIIKPKPMYDVVGSIVDVGRHNVGLPDDFFSYYEPYNGDIVVKRGNKVIRLLFNCAASCAVKPETIISKGAAVCTLIDALEYAGRRVEVMLVGAVSRSYMGRHIYDCYVPVKEAGHALDLGRLMFCLAHPSMLRRHMFAAWECLEDSVKSAFSFHSRGNYSYPTNPSNILEHDIYIDATTAIPELANPNLMITWITQKLKEQGVEINENAN
jgi:hypothetical protein